MRLHLTFLALLSSFALAEDKADLTRWTETFDSEPAFDANWGAYGWLPDGKTSSKKEDRPLWRELERRPRSSPCIATRKTRCMAGSMT